MNTRNKGALAEYRFISTAISLDFKVLKPAVEGYAYDCVIDNGTSFYKIQVKYASIDNRRKDTFSVMTHRRLKSSAPVYRRYLPEEVDFYAVYIWYIDTFFIIPYEALKNKKSISLRVKDKTNRYAQYKNNWAILQSNDNTTSSKEIPGGGL